MRYFDHSIGLTGLTGLTVFVGFIEDLKKYDPTYRLTDSLKSRDTSASKNLKSSTMTGTVNVDYIFREGT